MDNSNSPSIPPLWNPNHGPTIYEILQSQSQNHGRNAIRSPRRSPRNSISPIRHRNPQTNRGRSESISPRSHYLRADMDRSESASPPPHVRIDLDRSDSHSPSRGIVPKKFTRSFSMLNVTTGILSGRYISNQPRNAASKCFTQFARQTQLIADRSVDLYIQEITQGSKRKIYKYRCRRVKRDVPILVQYPYMGSRVQFEYHNCIHGLSIPIDIKILYAKNDINPVKSPLDIIMTYPQPIVVDDFIIEI